MNHIINKIKTFEKEFIEIRRKIHQNPEVGFEEEKTSAFIAETLKKWGYEVHTGLAKTGVVGVLKQGTSNKSIGIRADIDALPMLETTDKPWKSTVPGKFHGCGHDGHTTILLCAAKYLAETRNFDGTINLIFQPAEELLYGGKVMLDDKLFERFPCDRIFALHNFPGLKTGEFYFKDNAMMASSDTVHINVIGTGSHGAMPENGIDATMIACYIGTALQTIVSRNVSPLSAAVITIGALQSGNAPNIINEKALMKLTVRCLDNNVRQKILARINEVAQMQAKSFGAKVEIEHVNGSPVLINDKEMNDFVKHVTQRIFGENKTHEACVLMGSEDFAFMLEKNPKGCYFLIGNGDEPGYCNVHNGGYDFNDNCIVPAATLWAAITEDYLKK